MRGFRTQRGNITVLIVACMFVAIVLAVVAVNFAGTFRTHRQAQTAIDAAVLEAARIAAQAAVRVEPVYGLEGEGQIGLVDYSPGDPNHPANNPINGSMNLKVGQPVRGINTALATSRLDMVIADRLDQNRTILKFAGRELDEIKATLPSLAAQMRAFINNTANKKAIAAAYNSNGIAAATGPITFRDIQVTIGSLTPGSGSTDIPIPDGDPIAGAGANSFSNGGRRLYKPYVAIPVPNGTPVTFAAIADKPSLVDNSSFVPYSSAPDLPPSVVQVTITQGFNKTANDGKDQGLAFKVTATAQVGAPRVTPPSTTYSVAFVGGLPSEQTLNKLTPALHKDSVSVKDLMNCNGLWQPTTNQPSNFFQANASPVTSGFPSLSGIKYPTRPEDPQNQNPSEALSIGVYHWLRGNGLRPSVGQTVAKLSTPLIQLAKEDSVQLAMQPEFDLFAQPAYAKKNLGPDLVVKEAVPTITENNNDPEDPMDDTDFSPVPVVAQTPPGGVDPLYAALTQSSGNQLGPDGSDLLNSVFSFRQAKDPNLASQPVAQIDPVSGSATTLNGEQIATLCRLVEGLIATNRAANTSRYGGLLATRIVRGSRDPSTTIKHQGKLPLINKVQTLVGELDEGGGLRQDGEIGRSIIAAQTRLTEAYAKHDAVRNASATDKQAAINAYNTAVTAYIGATNQANGKINEYNQLVSTDEWQYLLYGAVNNRAVGDPDAQMMQITTYPVPLNMLFRQPMYYADRYAEERHLLDECNIEVRAPELTTAITDRRLLIRRQEKRWQEVLNRAIAARYQGIYGNNRAVRSVRRLRVWSSNGVVQMYKEQAGNDPESSLMFVVNFGGQGGGHGHAPKRAARCINILPNNEFPCDPQHSVVRYPDPAGGSYFDVNYFEPQECCDMARNLCDVHAFVGGTDQNDPRFRSEYNLVKAKEKDFYTHIDRGKFDLFDARVETGNDHIQCQGNETSHSKGNGPAGTECPVQFRSRWDIYRDGVAYNVGLQVHRRYTKANLYRISGEFAIDLPKLRQDFDEARKKSSTAIASGTPRKYDDWLCQAANADVVNPDDANTFGDDGESTGPEVANPQVQSIFIFGIVGDQSAPQKDQGFTLFASQTAATTKCKVLSGLESYPFQNNGLAPGQLLYLESSALKQGAQGAETFRNVIARDQQADINAQVAVSSADLDRISSPRDWCSNPKYGFNSVYQFGGTAQCPYSSGEWRLGGPFTFSCCSLSEMQGTRAQLKKLFHIPIPRRFARSFWDLNLLNEQDYQNDQGNIPPGESIDPGNPTGGGTNLCPQLSGRIG